MKNGHKNVNDGLSKCWSNQIKKPTINVIYCILHEYEYYLVNTIIICIYILFQENTNKSDSGGLEKWQHITEKNSLKHINMYPDALKGFNNKYSNSLGTSLNYIEDVPKRLNRRHTSTESCNTSNSKHNVCLYNLFNYCVYLLILYKYT